MMENCKLLERSDLYNADNKPTRRKLFFDDGNGISNKEALSRQNRYLNKQTREDYNFNPDTGKPIFNSIGGKYEWDPKPVHCVHPAYAMTMSCLLPTHVKDQNASHDIVHQSDASDAETEHHGDDAEELESVINSGDSDSDSPITQKIDIINSAAAEPEFTNHRKRESHPPDTPPSNKRSTGDLKGKL